MMKENNTERQFTTAMTRPIGPNGEVYVHHQVIRTPLDINLTIGLFFDGTGCNALNTQLRREVQQQRIYDRNHKTDLPIYDRSYQNDETNIYKLFQMYHKDDEIEESVRKSIKELDYQMKIYIEGVGTLTGKSDNTLGLGTAFGVTGISAKIERTITELKKALSKFITENPKTRFKSIQYDLFGFSRGAATARYFANLVADSVTPKRSDNPLTTALKEVLAEKVSRNWQGNFHNGKVRFLGIFDTVASLGNLSNFFDAGDANTFDIDIAIKPNTVKSGLHIEAAHEYRTHFSLNRAPAFFKTVVMPGAHSDIGGGYPERGVEERLHITPIYTDRDVPFYEDHRLRERLQNERDRFTRHPELRHLFPQLDEDTFNIWRERIRYDNEGYCDFYATLRIVRFVKSGLEQIALRIMYNEAVVQGCNFSPFLPNDYPIPLALQPLANKMITAAKSYHSYLLTEQEKALVLGQFVHCSAEYEHFVNQIDGSTEVIDERTGELKTVSWRVVVEKAESHENLLQVHAPHLNRHGDWQRRVHPQTDQE